MERSLQENKSELRKKYRQIRKNIDRREEKSEAIFKKVAEIKEYKMCRSVAVYISFSTEVETLKFIEKAFKDKKRVLVPKVLGKEMSFFEIEENTELKEGAYGILEPYGAKEGEIDSKTLVIVPGLSFTPMGERLGYGGGYYDRALKGAQTLLKVGVCFEEQISKILPTEESDQRVDLVVTEREIKHED